MSIKPRKNKILGEVAQEQSLSDIVEEVKVKNDTEEEFNKIFELLPILQQYNKDLVVGQNNIINERLGIEHFIQWCDNKFKVMEQCHKELLDKYDTLVSNLDKIIETAPQKLTITAVISEADMKAIQQRHDAHINKMKELHVKQITELQKHFEHERDWMYDRNSEQQKTLHERLKSKNLYCVSGISYWVNRIFYWTGVITTISFIVIHIYKATH